MAFIRLANALALLQLSLLLCCSSTTVHDDAILANYHPPAHAPHHTPLPPPPHHHHHHHHPTPPPSRPPTPPPSPSSVKPPSHPPAKPPSPPPAKPPSPPPAKSPNPPPAKPPSYLPPRKMVAVQGVVFCKSCKFRGINTLIGASPLARAVVKLQCNNTKYGLVEQTVTDKNGYFFFMPHKLTTAAFHKCKVFLVSSPLSTCSVPTNLNGGASGALLIPTAKPPVKATTFQLFSVGPFAFESLDKRPCHY